jgi:hypothetical protein
VLVSAPVKDASDPVLNIVYGVNHDKYDPAVDHIVTAASCTTNCLAPVVNVIQSKLGIVRGSITTIHNVTNTQARSVITLVPIRPRWRGERRSLRTFADTNVWSTHSSSVSTLDRVGPFQLTDAYCIFCMERPSSDHRGRPQREEERPAQGAVGSHEPRADVHGERDRDRAHLPGAQREAQRPRRARASVERVRSTMSLIALTGFHTVRPRRRREGRFLAKDFL